MWEKPRVDGKKKLKWNALPTIFPPTTNKMKLKSKTKKVPDIFFATNSTQTQTDSITTTPSAIITDVNESSTHANSVESQPINVSNTSIAIVNSDFPSLFHNYAQPPSKELEKNCQNSQGVQVNDQSLANICSPLSTSDFSESFVSDVNSPATLNNADLFKKIYHYQKSYTQLLAKVDSYKEQIRALKQNNERLVKIAKKDRHLRLLKHVFNDDQICALERRNSRFMKWSQSTLVNALRIKNYCGKDGYEEILRQKIPLPSIRTLNRIKITDSVCSIMGINHFST